MIILNEFGTHEMEIETTDSIISFIVTSYNNSTNNLISKHIPRHKKVPPSDKYCTHYLGNSNVTMSGSKLAQFGQAAAQTIIGLISKKYQHLWPILIYSGMSGTALATATALTYQNLIDRHNFAKPEEDRLPILGQIYCRKDHEQSHGLPIERSNVSIDKYEDYLFIFIDDFISHGDTFYRCFKRMLSYFREIQDEVAILEECSRMLENDKIIAITGVKKHYEPELKVSSIYIDRMNNINIPTYYPIPLDQY